MSSKHKIPDRFRMAPKYLSGIYLSMIYAFLENIDKFSPKSDFSGYQTCHIFTLTKVARIYENGDAEKGITGIVYDCRSLNWYRSIKVLQSVDNKV